MYQGSNPTALQSQRWLAEALVSLMGEQPYGKISIRDICQRADLSRQTFYNFFSSKEEVLRFCLQSRYREQFDRLREREHLALDQAVEAFAVVLEENRALLSAMLSNGLEGIVADEIARCVSLFAERFASVKDEVLPYSQALLSGALAHLLLHWFRQEKPVSTERLCEILNDFLRGKLFVME